MDKVIAWSIRNRFLVLLATLILTVWGITAIRQTPLDAIPDLSDVQVIIRTSFPGQSPRVVEDQVLGALVVSHGQSLHRRNVCDQGKRLPALERKTHPAPPPYPGVRTWRGFGRAVPDVGCL